MLLRCSCSWWFSPRVSRSRTGDPCRRCRVGLGLNSRITPDPFPDPPSTPDIGSHRIRHSTDSGPTGPAWATAGPTGGRPGPNTRPKRAHLLMSRISYRNSRHGMNVWSSFSKFTVKVAKATPLFRGRCPPRWMGVVILTAFRSGLIRRDYAADGSFPVASSVSCAAASSAADRVGAVVRPEDFCLNR